MPPTSNQLLAQLPRTLAEWRLPEAEETWLAEAALWEAVRPVFERARIDLWRSANLLYQRARPGEVQLSSGFAYLTPQRESDWAHEFKAFNHWNGLIRGATTAEGHVVMVRIVAIGDEGKAHMDILRSVGQGVTSLRTDNHSVPLWQEVHLEDMIFAVCPFVGATVDHSYALHIKNSVGDIVDMILQCLEALAFIHSIGIAHRDTDKSNFLVQWHPESLVTMRVPISRPRVYLNDFEHAFKHSPGTTSTSVTLPAEYQRPIAPEMHSGSQYEPFKPDVWQLANSFSDFQSTIPSIDGILSAMAGPEASTRLSAAEARDQLAKVINSMLPESLLIAPIITTFD